MAIEEDKIAFVTANFVAKAVGYTLEPDWLKGDWEKGDKATRDLFQSDAFDKEFNKMLQIISNAGFKTVELWTTHLDYNASQERVQRAKQILDRHGISVCSYAGDFGNSEEEIEKSFRIAKTIGVKVLAGGLDEKLLPKAYELCQKYRISFAFENHPEMETPEKLQKRINGKRDWFGATVDTGWYATFGINPEEAIRKLRKSVLHVHLKDIKEVGKHESCTLGDGIVNIPGVLYTLKEINYRGYVGIEHEPGDHNPTEDIKESLHRLRRWLKETQ